MEKLLLHIWKHKILRLKPLHRSKDEEMEIVGTGQQNPHAGPNFINSKVCIGQTM